MTPPDPSPEELQLRLAAIVETSDDAIVSKDLNGIVRSWNAGAQRIFGYTPDEIVGRPINIIIPADRQDEEPAILDKLKRGERVDHYQTIRRHKDGTLLSISVTISPIKDSTGRVIGASKIARDITETLQLQRERDELLIAERAARGEAERANRMKDEFIATLSHELRTPLNAILGWSQLIARSPGDQETINEGMAIIERNARAQTQLIEDLLDMGRIISGKVRLDVQRLDLVAVIEAGISAVRLAADAKEIRLVKALDPRAVIAGDPNRMQQVIWNLLSNAIKFTPHHGRVEIVMARVESHVEITVRDSGRGIQKEFLPYVFDRFRQADASITREYGGLGIGLAIVKHLVELHGGRVIAQSDGEGKGAAFVIELPLGVQNRVALDNESNGSHMSQQKVRDQVSLRDLTVLVVDDEADARDLVARVLVDCGGRAFKADSAEQAIAVLHREKIDVLVSDIGMPGVDGYQFMRNVRRHKGGSFQKIPAIALTAFARPEDRTRAMMAGFQVHISKPVDAQELLAAVASLLGRTGYAVDAAAVDVSR